MLQALLIVCCCIFVENLLLYQLNSCLRTYVVTFTKLIGFAIRVSDDPLVNNRDYHTHQTVDILNLNGSSCINN